MANAAPAPDIERAPRYCETARTPVPPGPRADRVSRFLLGVWADLVCCLFEWGGCFGCGVVVWVSGGGVVSWRSCGIVAPPGDVHELATAVVTLLRNPDLAGELGRRGYERLSRRYTLAHCIESYRKLIGELLGEVVA